jgi:hypothetical protein
MIEPVTSSDEVAVELCLTQHPLHLPGRTVQIKHAGGGASEGEYCVPQALQMKAGTRAGYRTLGLTATPPVQRGKMLSRVGASRVKLHLMCNLYSISTTKPRSLRCFALSTLRRQPAADAGRPSRLPCPGDPQYRPSWLTAAEL